MSKFLLVCKKCGTKIPNFSNWFSFKQHCPTCNYSFVKVSYNSKFSIPNKVANNFKGIWRYFDFLPVQKKSNIISLGEGDVPIDRWEFLEHIAKNEFGLNIKVYAHCNDRNQATGTFKDLAGSLIATILLENNITEYVVASTGNIGVSCSKYCREAGIKAHIFIPYNASVSYVNEISEHSQKCYRIKGNYEKVKKAAYDFSQKHEIVLGAGTFDPMRIEAKKTMAYEWVRKIDMSATVYIQALSGGTGLLGVHCGVMDIIHSGIMSKLPRYILVQGNLCNPMANAWQKSKEVAFPNGWEKKYKIHNNCCNGVVTLSTGDPVAYPIIAPLVKYSNGEIITANEQSISEISKLVFLKTSTKIGHASAIAIGGFFKSLKKNYIRDGETVIINIGDGARI